jgi:3-oxoacyl-[acyl-carrier protein] reductase
MLAEHGLKELTITDVRKEPLDATGGLIADETGLSCLAIAGDIRDEKADEEMVAEAVRRMGRIDILVNCAGVSRPGSIFDVTEEQWDFTFDINVKGMFFLCRAVWRTMEEQGGGCIVNMSSQAARSGGLMLTPDYPTSKGGVLTMTKTLAKAGAPKGIRVNAVSPGLISTEMTANYHYDPQTVPMGRIGTGEDVAGAVLFLCSDYASYITGACVDVNGGLSMI